MTKMNWIKMAVAAVAGMLFAGCATVPDTESKLSASGFKVHVADTPEQLEKLKGLPQHELTPQKRHGQVFWVYPDADQERIYVGTQDQYNLYQQTKMDAEIAAQYQDAAEMNLMSAQMDAMDMYWGAWGPWY